MVRDTSENVVFARRQLRQNSPDSKVTIKTLGRRKRQHAVIPTSLLLLMGELTQQPRLLIGYCPYCVVVPCTCTLGRRFGWAGARYFFSCLAPHASSSGRYCNYNRKRPSISCAARRGSEERKTKQKQSKRTARQQVELVGIIPITESSSIKDMQ